MITHKEEKTKTYTETEYTIKCDICKKVFISRWESRSCSNECYEKLKPQLKKEAVKRSTQHRKFVRDEIRAASPDTICTHCHQPFRPLRNDAKFCSDKCKQADYRQRKSAINEPTIPIPVVHGKRNKNVEEKPNPIEEVKTTLDKLNKIKIIVFSSPTCGPCRTYKEKLKKLEKNKKFVETCELNILDVDENADLARSYGVQSLPTTVILGSDGKQLDFLQGSTTAAKLQRCINKKIN